MSSSSSPPSRSVVLPTQNQLFAYFMLLCGHHGIKKPPKVFMDVLEEDDVSRNLRLQHDADALHLPTEVVAGQEEIEDAAHGVSPLKRAAVVPLASMTRIVLGEGRRSNQQQPRNGIVVGNRGVIVWLRVCAECPLLEVFDLEEFSNIFTVDAYQQCPSGNHVMEVLCEILDSHPSVNTVLLRGHPLGTVAGQRVLDAARRNRRITRVEYDQDGVDRLVVHQITKQLELNRKGGATLSPPLLPTVLSSALEPLRWVDRKTSSQRQTLRNMIQSMRAFDASSLDEIDTIINHAELVSLETAMKDSAGLRGDREHLCIIESGEVEVLISNVPFVLSRGDYFGHNYENVMFSAGLIHEKTHGRAYRIPLKFMSSVLRRWETAVEEFFPLLKMCVALQGVHVWMLLRACHTCTRRTHATGEVVTPHGVPFLGLFVVVKGSYEVSGSKVRSANDASLKRNDSVLRKMENSSKSITLLDQRMAADEHRRSLKALDQALQQPSAAAFAQSSKFCVGDAFGEEPTTLRRVNAYVSEIACVDSAGAECLHLLPEGSLPIIQTIKPMLRLITKQYSLATE